MRSCAIIHPLHLELETATASANQIEGQDVVNAGLQKKSDRRLGHVNLGRKWNHFNMCSDISNERMIV